MSLHWLLLASFRLCVINQDIIVYSRFKAHTTSREAHRHVLCTNPIGALMHVHDLHKLLWPLTGVNY